VRKCREAIEGRAEHVNAFIEFDAALPVASTESWTARCQAWERDRSQPNPFKKKQAGNQGCYLVIMLTLRSLVISDANIRLRLAQEDAAAIERGDKELVHENISPSMLIYQGLEFEDFQ